MSSGPRMQTCRKSSAVSSPTRSRHRADHRIALERQIERGFHIFDITRHRRGQVAGDQQMSLAHQLNLTLEARTALPVSQDCDRSRSHDGEGNNQDLVQPQATKRGLSPRRGWRRLAAAATARVDRAPSASSGSLMSGVNGMGRRYHHVTDVAIDFGLCPYCYPKSRMSGWSFSRWTGLTAWIGGTGARNRTCEA